MIELVTQLLSIIMMVTEILKNISDLVNSIMERDKIINSDNSD